MGAIQDYKKCFWGLDDKWGLACLRFESYHYDMLCFAHTTQQDPFFHHIDVMLRPRQYSHMIPLGSPRPSVLDHNPFGLVAETTN